MESCNRDKESIYAKEGKGIPVVKGREEKNVWVHRKQLRKEYIRLLKLPQTAFVFFVGKKNGKKRMVQNYRYLNEWTIKDLR